MVFLCQYDQVSICFGLEL